MPFTLTMPKLSPTMEEGVIAAWHAKVGDLVEAGQLLLEVSTDKATVEYNALDTGYLRQIIVPEGSSAKVNAPVAVFTEEAQEKLEASVPAAKETLEPKQPAAAPAAALIPKASSTTPTDRVKASPLAKRLAKEHQIDLTKIQGTGPGGRIMSRDLQGTQSHKQSVPSGTFEMETLTPIRKVIAERLQQAKMTIPHFYVTVSVNAEPLVNAREQLKAGDVKVTYNDFIIRAASLALRNHPGVNSGFDVATSSIIRFKSIDVCIAVSIPMGLITPILTNTDVKTIVQISQESRTLAEKARAGKLQLHEFQGGSFTVSNLGMYGVDDFSAIINPPQGAILAVSAIQDEPVVRGGQIVPGKTLKLTLSADHRVIDGAAAAAFMQTLKGFIENPMLLFI